MVILYILLLIYSVRYTFHIGQPVPYTFRDALMLDTESFLLLICAVPSAALFAEDWCSGRFLFAYLRTGKTGYAASSMLSTFIISALVSMISLSLFVIGLSFINPLVGNIEDVTYHDQLLMLTNGELLIKGYIFPYYLFIEYLVFLLLYGNYVRLCGARFGLADKPIYRDGKSPCDTRAYLDPGNDTSSARACPAEDRVQFAKSPVSASCSRIGKRLKRYHNSLSVYLYDRLSGDNYISRLRFN